MGHQNYSTRDWRISIMTAEGEVFVGEGTEGAIPFREWRTIVLADAGADVCPVANRIKFYVDSTNQSGGGMTEIEAYGRGVE